MWYPIYSLYVPYMKLGAIEPPFDNLIFWKRSGSIAPGFLNRHPSEKFMLSDRPCVLSVFAMDAFGSIEVQCRGLNFNTPPDPRFKIQDSGETFSWNLESWILDLGEYWSSMLGIELQYSRRNIPGGVLNSILYVYIYIYVEGALYKVFHSACYWVFYRAFHTVLCSKVFFRVYI